MGQGDFKFFDIDDDLVLFSSRRDCFDVYCNRFQKIVFLFGLNNQLELIWKRLL